MRNQHILLGIGGGIAAYKTPELIRKLVERGHEVIPILTDAGSKFVTSQTLAAVSKTRVRNDLWDEEAERSMGHIELGRWADVLIIAPATADLIARMASGQADDLLTTVHLATQAHVVVVPAMNQAMWLHQATQRNITQLRADGVRVIGPEHGDQACGDIGPGRMTEPSSIVAQLENMLSDERMLMGLNVLVTAGPTREAIDPVRFISNSSSGRQGLAIAKAAQHQGAAVTLICGPIGLPTPEGIDRIDVQTADEMKNAVMEKIDQSDIFFSVAAVSDYRPVARQPTKIKKNTDETSGMTLELEQTDDILQLVSNLDSPPFTVGFAAETHNVLDFGREKLQRKNLDAIVVNDVSNSSIGFDSEDNEVTVITRHGECKLPMQSKDDIARRVVTTIAEIRSKPMHA